MDKYLAKIIKYSHRGKEILAGTIYMPPMSKELLFEPIDDTESAFIIGCDTEIIYMINEDYYDYDVDLAISTVDTKIKEMYEIENEL